MSSLISQETASLEAYYKAGLSIPVATEEQYTVQRWKGFREAIQFFAQYTEIAVQLDFKCPGFEGGG